MLGVHRMLLYSTTLLWHRKFDWLLLLLLLLLLSRHRHLRELDWLLWRHLRRLLRTARLSLWHRTLRHSALWHSALWHSSRLSAAVVWTVRIASRHWAVWLFPELHFELISDVRHSAHRVEHPSRVRRWRSSGLVPGSFVRFRPRLHVFAEFLPA